MWYLVVGEIYFKCVCTPVGTVLFFILMIEDMSCVRKNRNGLEVCELNLEKQLQPPLAVIGSMHELCVCAQ